MKSYPNLALGPLPILFVGILAFVSLSLSGCEARSSTDVPETSHRDSAGVRIVENVAARWPSEPSEARWQVSPQPTLEIGTGIGTGGQEAYQFNGVRNALRLPDGQVAIADAGSRQIRIFDEAGRHVRTLGGRGDGPGEFVALSTIGSVGDGSIGAWDGNRKRLTIFDARGAVAQTTDVPSIGGMQVRAVGWFADGSVVVEPSGNPMEIMGLEPGRHRIPRRYLRVTRSGTVDTLAVLAGREQVVERGEGEGRVSFRNVVFGRDGYAAVGPHFFYSGDSGAFAIEQRTPPGILERIIRKAGDPRPVTQTDLEAALDGARERQREMVEQLGGSIDQDDPPARDEHPYFDFLVADGTGSLWVRLADPDPENEPQRWLVFDQQGAWLGQAETPAGLHISDIGADYVLGVTTDDLDIQRVQMYGLSR